MSERLRNLFKENGLLLSDVANLLELPRSCVTDRLNGKTEWRNSEITKILRKTKSSYEEIFFND